MILHLSFLILTVEELVQNQHYPTELSAVMEMHCICAVQCDTH